MNIPFIDLWNKAKTYLASTSAPPPAPAPRAVPTEKRSGERMSKTVLPNTTRNLSPVDPFQAAASGVAPRKPGAARSGVPFSRDLPPMVAFALEPKVERVISLPLSDILGQVPSGYVKPPETFDPKRVILLKASEVERGMAKQQPAVLLSSIYEQVPEIFLRSVTPGDATEVVLPFDKVMTQFESASVRTDQVRDMAVPQVDTPILQATIEDTERFGTTMEPLQASDRPPVKVEHASAKSLAAAEPESAVRAPASARSTIPLSELGIAAPEPPPAAPSKYAPPARIPFHLPPNGTGASAPERVPASSGPPVPIREPKAPEPPIPFRVRPPSDDLRPQLTLVPGVEQAEGTENFAPPPKASSKQDERKISLPLQAVFQNLPAFQLNGSPSEVPEGAQIQFPLSLIQPQLAVGRVCVPPLTFQKALPKQHRDLFVIDPSQTPVMLPLQEVLKNLPAAALEMRKDQEQTEIGEAFETPFSIQAKEDAQRFKEAAAITPEATAPAETPTVSEAAPKIDIEEKIDAKEIVARASALPGVAACSITFADGLILAGNLPQDVAAEGLCAMAPSLLQRIENHMLDTNLGSLTAMTLHCAKSAFSFFMHGNICLGVLHTAGEFPPETRSKLAEMAQQLSRTYAKTEPAHVDH